MVRIEKKFIHHSSKPQDPSTLAIFWVNGYISIAHIIPLGVGKELFMGV
jgi:hypothetical protein